jgi:molybdopterin converting factor small subunit
VSERNTASEGTRLAKFERIRFCVELNGVIKDYDEVLEIPIMGGGGVKLDTWG